MSKPREPVRQPWAEGIIVGGTVRGKEMEKSKVSRLKCHLCKREKEHESRNLSYAAFSYEADFIKGP